MQVGVLLSQNVKNSFVMDEPFVPNTWILKKECQPDRYQEILSEANKLELSFQNSYKTYRISKTKKYKLLFSVKHFEGLSGQFDCAYFGGPGDIVNGRKLYELYDELEHHEVLDDGLILFDNKYVVIHGDYVFIGAINRYYHITYYLELIVD